MHTGDITMNADLNYILEHIRQLAQTHPNKSVLAEATDIRYHRLQLFCSRKDAMLWPSELQQLANYFGIKIFTDIVPVTLEWISHPANTAYEYEVDSSRRPTGRVRSGATKEIVTPKASIAAE